MVYQEDFGVERWMDKYEHQVELNISETCCDSISLNQLADLCGEQPPMKEILDTPLTYGPIPGSDKLRSIISEIQNETSRGPITIGKDDVITANGCINANFLVWYSLVGPEDHVVCVNPVYQQLKSVPKMFGSDVSALPLRKENKFLPDIAELKSLLKSNTKMIVLSSPHNPSGSVIPEKTMLEIVAIAKSAGVYLMVDEVYRPLHHSMPDGVAPASPICTLYEKGISTCSTSKAFSMAGLRVGWIASSDKEFLKTVLSRRDYCTISISRVDDALACYALANRKYVLERSTKICLDGLAMFDAFIAASNGAVSFVRPVGGSVLLLEIANERDTKAFCADVADKKSVMLVPGEVFDTPGSIRIGFGTRTSLLRAGLERLQEYLEEHKGAKFGKW